MAKIRQVFVCRACGTMLPRWMGKCPDCGTWDSLEAQTSQPSATRDPQRGLVEGWAAVQAGEEITAGTGETPRAVPVAEIGDESGALHRLRTGIHEFDRVLGGGIVPGSALLIGGEPGIGKSTLLLQAAGALAKSGVRVLYISSEESAEQVRMRAHRLGVADEAELFVLADTNLARIVEQARITLPRAIVVDSIQMIYKGDLDAPPGSLTQLRRCASDLVFLAKASGIAVALVGHVTKDGQLAGPRLLEHVVDAVVYFEGDRMHAHRVVRAVKNRFGTTLEIGIFEMSGEGLIETAEGTLIAPINAGPMRAGSVVCPVMHGSRCLMVEVQALTATGFLGAAKRKSSGLDPNRLAMLIAVLEQHAGLRLADRDIFASAVGGVRVVEPAADLALLLAIAGAHNRRGIPPATCAIGEVGLGGELRPVTGIEQRLREAARLGFTRVLVGTSGKSAPKLPVIAGLRITPVADVAAAMEQLDPVEKTPR
ncbi:MAG: DNA repair protein RadA [Phycisphaeraceae bacterium]|nr:DNA repair protein RadA [Phycisphaeraceae bacterium]